jgi:DNA-binding transcriptional MerR regulator
MEAKQPRAADTGRARSVLTIRELVRQTGVTTATVHHYIALGLLPAPERPHRRMAFYDPACVGRIAQIKALQKRFLPLGVIKKLLERGGATTLREADARLLEAMDVADARESREEVLRRYPIGESALAQLAKPGLIGSGPALSADEVAIVGAVHAMRAAGLDERMGFSAEQLGFYRQILDRLIDAEFATFNERVLGRVPPEEEVRLATIAIEASTRLMTALHRRMVRERLAGILGGGAGSPPPPRIATRRTSPRRKDG